MQNSTSSSSHMYTSIAFFPPMPTTSASSAFMALHQPLFFFFLLFSSASLVRCQQQYVGRATTNCGNTDSSTTALGYFCNYQPTASCLSYLTFHSLPPYQSVSSISSLLGSDPTNLSEANSVSLSDTFPTDAKLLVPVACSCSGGYSQSNTSYLVQKGDTYFLIANNTYQGLSTCQALETQNGISPTKLDVGSNISVPLRCACPTGNQTGAGVEYLLSYLVDQEDTVFTISQRFGVDTDSTLAANGLSQKNSKIYPFTTLLVPLKSKPNSSQILTPSLSPPPPPPSPSSSSSPSSDDKLSTGAYVGIGAAVLAIAFMVLFCMCCRRAKKGRKEQTLTSSDTQKLSGNLSEKSSGATKGVLLEISEIGEALKEYKYVDLRNATEDFSEECRIDESVYRGVFKGDAAAIKVMNRDVKKEVDMLKKINHSNLVRLSGFCFHQGQWFLVYEYAENGSLSEWLFGGRGSSRTLSWIQRVQIALDVADGLDYLHNHIEPSYVHKDINCSNILLDGSFKAKIANFALARPTEGDEDEPVLTRHIVGSQGYMAPEYLEHGLISPKLDIYAFGIVMMEMITGKGVLSARREVEAFSREASVDDIHGGEDPSKELIEFIDPFLEGNYPLEPAALMFKLISECLRRDAVRRPDMVDIVQSLSGILAASVPRGIVE